MVVLGAAAKMSSWSEGLEDEQAHIRERFELCERLFVQMREAGIEMPYETLQLAPFEVQSGQSAAA